MQICEFHRDESTDRVECFEGRWCWTKKFVDGGIRLQWTDLFGHEDIRFFNVLKPEQPEKFHPLTREFGILQRVGSAEHTEALWGVKLNWVTSNCTVGNVAFEPLKDCDSEVLINRAYSTGDISFLLYADDEQHLHCRLDINTLCVTQIGVPFTLSTNELICMDFNGDIISGLRRSLTEILRFNVRTRQFLDSIQIYGLPSTVGSQFGEHGVDRSAAAWTHNKLFVWTEDGDQNAKFSTIYSVHLDSGVACSTPFIFNNHIQCLIAAPDGQHLYVRNNKVTQLSPRTFKHGHGEIRRDVMRPYLKYSRYFRIPLNSPESLFFLSSVAIPRPLTPVVTQIIAINRKEVVPIQVYK